MVRPLHRSTSARNGSTQDPALLGAFVSDPKKESSGGCILQRVARTSPRTAAPPDVPGFSHSIKATRLPSRSGPEEPSNPPDRIAYTGHIRARGIALRSVPRVTSELRGPATGASPAFHTSPDHSQPYSTIGHPGGRTLIGERGTAIGRMWSSREPARQSWRAGSPRDSLERRSFAPRSADAGRWSGPCFPRRRWLVPGAPCPLPGRQ